MIEDNISDVIRCLDVPVSEEEKAKIADEWLRLPQDLTGRQILELFSGDRENSFRDIVEARGGAYSSVDIASNTGVPTHVMGDVYHLENYFSPDSFDYIILKHPIIWGRHLLEKVNRWAKTPDMHDLTQFDRFIDLLTKAMALLKRESGSFLAIANRMSDKDYAATYRALQERMPLEEFDKWLITSEDTGESKAVTHSAVVLFKGRITLRRPYVDKERSRTLRIIRK